MSSRNVTPPSRRNAPLHHAAVTPPEVKKTEGTTSPIHPSSTSDVMDGWVLRLMSRGVDRLHAQKLVRVHPVQRLADAVDYFDALGSASAGPGLLVVAIREGRKPRKSKLADQKEYGVQVVAWLRRHFPELNQGDGTHPAAFVAVTHLHQRLGRGSLTAAEHGPAIRAAVERWDSREEAA